MTAKRAPPRRQIDGAGVLRTHLNAALSALKGNAKLSDAAVHSARKELKRARATLRLLREVLGEPAYVRDNAALRDAARPLSRVRDAKVLVDTVKSVIEDRPRQPLLGPLLKLQAKLEKERMSLRPERMQGAGDFKEIVQSLEAALRRVAKYSIAGESSKTMEKGIQRIYHHGRRARTKLDAEHNDENLHQLRKEVKYLAQAMKTLVPIAAASLEKSIKHAESIADDLGEDHDLAVLQEKIAALSPQATKADKALAAQLGSRRSRLQKRASKRSRKLYRKRAPSFAAALKVS